LFTLKEIEVIKLRKLHLTQQEVAKKLGISQAAVCVFERKTKQKLKEAQRVLEIAKKLHIEVDKDE